MKQHDKENKLLFKQRLCERRTKERQKIKRQSREDERDYESDAYGSQSKEGGMSTTIPRNQRRCTSRVIAQTMMRLMNLILERRKR